MPVYANKLHNANGRRVCKGLDSLFVTEVIRQRKEAMPKMSSPPRICRRGLGHHVGQKLKLSSS